MATGYWMLWGETAMRSGEKSGFVWFFDGLGDGLR